MEPARRLGRGLDALLGDPLSPLSPAEQARSTAPLALIHRNPRNPRRDFGPEDLDDLAASIRAHGIVQPLVVRRIAGAGEAYEIIAGERRWRAAQMAGLHEVPITVLDVDDRQALELAIVENVQRADLNPVEEARGYQALIEEFGYSQADLGATIGKSRVHVTNTLRLLKLPAGVLAKVAGGRISAGHARALLTAPDPEALADQVAEKGLSVRETERLAQRAIRPPRQKRPIPGNADELKRLERDMSQALGLRVELRHHGNRGEVRISYSRPEQLEAIYLRLRG